MKPVISIVVGLVVAGGAVGYFMNRNKIDTKDADDKIKGRIEEYMGPVTGVDCAKADRKKGSTFDCKVTLPGNRTETLHVEIFDDDGHYYAKFGRPIVNADKIATTAMAQAKQKNVDAKIDCGKGIVDLPADGLKCAMTIGNQSGHLVVKQDPKTGEVSWSAVADTTN